MSDAPVVMPGATTALAAENERLRARVAELEADRNGLWRAYVAASDSLRPETRRANVAEAERDQLRSRVAELEAAMARAAQPPSHDDAGRLWDAGHTAGRSYEKPIRAELIAERDQLRAQLDQRMESLKLSVGRASAATAERDQLRARVAELDGWLRAIAAAHVRWSSPQGMRLMSEDNALLAALSHAIESARTAVGEADGGGDAE